MSPIASASVVLLALLAAACGGAVSPVTLEEDAGNTAVPSAPAAEAHDASPGDDAAEPDDAGRTDVGPPRCIQLVHCRVGQAFDEVVCRCVGSLDAAVD